MGKQRIVRLRASNIKRLEVNAVDFSPEGNLIIVGGMNGEGKSSTLDSIEMALDGKRSFPPDPVHHGALSAEVGLTLTDYEVTRKIRPDGTHTLVVKNRDGSQKYGSPQELLDALKSDLSFDPLAFLRKSKREAVAALEQFSGLDFTELDKRRDTLYNERTLHGRDVTARENLVKGMPYHAGVPTEEVLVSDLVTELRRRQDVNRANLDRKREVAAMEATGVTLATEEQRAREAITEAETAIAKWQEALAARRDLLEESVAAQVQHALDLENARTEAAALADEDTAATEEEIRNIEDTNRKVRENVGYDAAKRTMEEAQSEYKRLTAEIEAIDAEKQQKTADAKMPIPGLGFGSDGLMYGGVPFEQCSSAEQLRVSVAMGAALNPELAVMLIRDGSLLDANSRAEVLRLADEYDLQVWLETVGKGGDCQLIIEEGRAKQ